MEKEIIHAYCIQLHGTTYDYQEEWQADRYHIGGKMYAMLEEIEQVSLFLH